MDIELKPCPFCGGEAHLERQGHVACKTGWPCVHTAYFNWGTPDEQNAAAITPWNTRQDHSPDARKMADDRSAELTTAWMAGAESVRERAARDAEDAARYRWLRENPSGTRFRVPCPDAIPNCKVGHRGPNLMGEELDAAIDAARAGERG